MNPCFSNLLDVWLQTRLLLVVFYQERQVLGPVVLKVPWQIVVHVVFCYWDVQVGVQVSRIFWWKETNKKKSP